MDVVSVMNRFHRLLLSWDYFNLTERASKGLGVYDELRQVPTSFKDLQEYKGILEPLLLEECGAQIIRGVEEGQVLSPHPAVVSAIEQEANFTYVRVAVEPEVIGQFGDNDLILLCKDNPESKNVRRELHAMGYCDAHEGEQSLRVKFYLSDDSQLGNDRGLRRVGAMRANLTVPNSCWYILRLFSMSTITREWVALQHAHLMPFADVLFSAKPTTLHESKHMDIPAGMRATMEAHCNSSQMAALQAGLDGTPVVLIQGPPGTGKTRTILNLLSVIMYAAHKGSLELVQSKKDGGAGLKPRERLAVWREQCPWLFAQPNIRDLVRPDEEDVSGGMADVFGILQRCPPFKVGKTSGPRAHVLVCAPSNSALDEIVFRILSSGLLDKHGSTFAPSIVRVGVNVHHSVKSVALETLVDKRLGTSEQSGKVTNRNERDRMRIALLDEAHLVCSTLSFAGASVFYRLSKKFDVVVIDEAAQAVEPSTLVPLVMGCKQVYLVGDPVQLPATVLSGRAVEHHYDMSMFKRLQIAGYPVHILNTQYRMHPDISRFPSDEFYGGKLLDGESVRRETVRPWHELRCFGPFAFYDVIGKEETPEGSASMVNKAEAELVLCLYIHLVQQEPAIKTKPLVAVISPYKAQVKLLRDLFTKALGEEGVKNVDINTIDGFQGREKDITLFSCVRSSLPNQRRSIGFVADERRINVGLTRARCALLIIGNARSLASDEHWGNLVRGALQRGAMYRPTKPYRDYMAKVTSGGEGPVAVSDKELKKLAPSGKKRTSVEGGGAHAGDGKKAKG